MSDIQQIMEDMDGVESWWEVDTALTVKFNRYTTSASEVFETAEKADDRHEYNVVMLTAEKLQFQK